MFGGHLIEMICFRISFVMNAECGKHLTHLVTKIDKDSAFSYTAKLVSVWDVATEKRY